MESKSERRGIWIFLAGGICGVVVLALAPLVVLALGAIDFSAEAQAGFFERNLAPWAFERSMAARAPEKENPYADDPAAVAVGRGHFAAMCVVCHGAPGQDLGEIAIGLNPPAPRLESEVHEYSDGELFWITGKGIRMTGMPAFGLTHSDEDIWKIVAFLRELPALSPEEAQALGESDAGHGHHGTEETHEAETPHEAHDREHGAAEAEPAPTSGEAAHEHMHEAEREAEPEHEHDHAEGHAHY